MLEKIFLQILNMSFTASFVIIFVLIARLLLKKSPKVLSYPLWGVVLFRLICPFSFESMFSLLPAKTNPISQDIVYAHIPTIDTGIPAINHTVNQLLPAATPAASVNPLQIWVFIGSAVWLMGMSILLIYSIFSLVKLQKRLKNAVHEKDNIYLAGASTGPFCHEVTGPKCQLTAGGCVKCGGELRHPVQGVPQPCKVLREFLFYYVSDDMIVNNHFLALFSVHEAMRTGLVDEPWATGCVPEDFFYGVIREYVGDRPCTAQVV